MFARVRDEIRVRVFPLAFFVRTPYSVLRHCGERGGKCNLVAYVLRTALCAIQWCVYLTRLIIEDMIEYRSCLSRLSLRPCM